jgi:hypothetical protein
MKTISGDASPDSEPPTAAEIEMIAADDPFRGLQLFAGHFIRQRDAAVAESIKAWRSARHAWLTLTAMSVVYFVVIIIMAVTA